MDFYKAYFEGFSNVLNHYLNQPESQAQLQMVIDKIVGTQPNNNTVFLIGNGGSSAIAEHMAVDLTKNAKLNAKTISGTPMLTTFANDYGYEHIFSKPLERYAKPGDVVLAISSGGNSQNIVNVCDTARKAGLFCATFTGFQENNKVRKLGDVNIWIDSKSYGYVELIHNLLIHYINDAIIGAIEY